MDYEFRISEDDGKSFRVVAIMDELATLKHVLSLASTGDRRVFQTHDGWYVKTHGVSGHLWEWKTLPDTP